MCPDLYLNRQNLKMSHYHMTNRVLDIRKHNLKISTQLKDIMRNCRKSPKMAILTILHAIKSAGYEHQNHRIRVFRQSLQISAISNNRGSVRYIKGF